uniref:ABC transmembrane type-1 domain-containing protein n=1 Tax=Timema tahoe TaxID=61484 RepID=A0A7R9ICG3_9NEOP|nr:unnamed protein product [Timema tahoe]
MSSQEKKRREVTDHQVTHANSTLSNVSYGAVEDDTKYYLTVYGILAGLNSVFTLLRAFLFAYAGLHAATTIHKLLLNSIMRVRADVLKDNFKTRVPNEVKTRTSELVETMHSYLSRNKRTALIRWHTSQKSFAIPAIGSFYY